ncbi:transcriptional repressor general negative regulator of transcription subunit 4, partial [Coemansia nantahalensis]
VAKLKNEKRAKEREKREIESNSRRHLANVRVVQKNLVYVIGLPANLATEEILRSQDYFGQFGRINKIVINRRQGGSNSQHPTVGVYVTYAVRDDAARAINAVDGSMLEGRVLRATFGTTKYCSYYLRSIPCQNPGCMYLHEPGEEADSFTKEDLAANRAGFRESLQGAFDHDDERSTAPQCAPGRARKASDISAMRPHSVEPHNDGGSALPATASWASWATPKKPAETARRGEGGNGTMTLRMLPASRGKTKAAQQQQQQQQTGRGRAAAATVATATEMAAAAADSGSPHHPMLQQMSRERKQQMRQQARAQQRAHASVDGSDRPPKQNQRTPKQNQRTPKQNQRTPKKAAAAAAATAAAAAAAAEADPGLEQTAMAPQDPAAPAAEAASAAAAVAELYRDDLAPELPQHEPAVASGASQPPLVRSHASSAQSFQSIADSLFAQLNARVAPPANTMAGPFAEPMGPFAESVGPFSESVGLFGEPPVLGRHAGHPISSVDPLLFPPSTAGGGGVLRAEAHPGMLGSPWGDLRGRWDQALVDESNAQAELQLVLGRGPQQAASGPLVSRNLGMFATPQPWGEAAPPPPGFGPPAAAAADPRASRADAAALSGMLSHVHLDGRQHPGAQPWMGMAEPGPAAATGFMDPAIMQMGRLSGTVGAGVPPAMGPPPGISSPAMGPRSSSGSGGGRSRFLSHFSVDDDVGAHAPPQLPPHHHPQLQPPPDTGLLGELLRRARQGADAPPIGAGKAMLGDIERRLGEARREASDLQAQLSTVIGHNQSALWALAGTGSAIGEPEARPATSAAGLGYSA